MKIIHVLVLLIFSLSSLIANGQSCSDYHNKNCRWAEESYLYNTQSRSALFVQGMTSEFAFTVYGNEEYYISACGDKKLGNIKIRVKEDNKKKTVLFDNSNYRYESYFYFKNENTRNLILEISSSGEKKFSKSLDRYCLGVLIENKNNTSK